MSFQEVKIIRVYTQGKASTCSRAYFVAKNKIKQHYSGKYIIEFDEEIRIN